jgi:hypothetical protein
MFFGLNDVAFLAAASAPAVPTDPFFANVSLLLHGDGANGSTTIIDSSPSPKTVTAVGDAQINTTVTDPFGRTGVGVMAFDGTGDYLSAGSNSSFAFGTGDFTIECWLYRSSSNQQNFSGLVQTVSSLAAPASTSNWQLGFGGSPFSNVNSLTFFIGTASNFTLNNSNVLPAQTWVHVAVSRQGNLFRLFEAGQLVGSGTATFSLAESTLWVGVNRGGNSFFDGYIDDLRITKGVARYTANFTPPTAPFPDA